MKQIETPRDTGFIINFDQNMVEFMTFENIMPNFMTLELWEHVCLGK